MRITISAVGRARAGPEQDLYQEYARRLPWQVTLNEVEDKRASKSKGADSGRRRREADLLLAATPKGATVVVLDETGAALSSRKLAAKIAAWRDQGVADIAFLIGGADGHGKAVRDRADFTLSLGAMTWPHLLARAMLAEQLYRASSILSGHPYHRG